MLIQLKYILKKDLNNFWKKSHNCKASWYDYADTDFVYDSLNIISNYLLNISQTIFFEGRFIWKESEKKQH